MVGSIVTLLAFVYLTMVLMRKLIPLNPTTWFLWTLLDAFIAYKMFGSKHESRWIMVGFTTGACIVGCFALAQVVQGKSTWTWSNKETLTLICFVIAFVISLVTVSEKMAINICTTAMLVAGIPVLIDAWHQPKGQDPVFWGTCTVGWIITLGGTPKGFTKRYMPIGGLILNGLIAALAIKASM
ncbi:MAG: hypothetical protein V4481_00675 [Patescibacteria group bacterium]